MTKKSQKNKTSRNLEDNEAIDANTFNPQKDNVNEEVEVSAKERGNRPKRRKVYERPSSTDIPKYVQEEFLKDEYALRLVRWAINGDPDYRYLNRRLQEGYEFVTADELPEEFLRSLHVKDTQITKGLVTNGGDLCFMKIDVDLKDSRINFYNNEAQKELDSVDIHILEKKGLRNVGSKSKVVMKEPSFQD